MPGTTAGVRIVEIWARTGQDVVVTHSDWSGGAPMTDAQAASAEGYFRTYWEAWRGIVRPEVILKELRYYNVAGGVQQGPAWMVRSQAAYANRAGASSATNQLPPQCSSALSFEVENRRRWGRSYLPPFTTQVTQVDGRVRTADLTTIVNAFRARRDSMVALGFAHVVFSAAAGGGINVLALAMDDIYDIQRRRRNDFVVTEARSTY